MPSSSPVREEGPQGKDHNDEPQPQGSQSRDWRAPARGPVQRPEEPLNGKAGDTWAGGMPIRVVVRVTLLPVLILAPTTSDLSTAKPLLFTTAARDPRLKGGGTTARSTELATATRPRTLLGDQKPSPREADRNPESTARDPRGDTASRSPSRAPPYLAGFVELLFEPGHRHRGSAPPGGGLGAPSGHAAATLSGAGTPGGPRAPHGHGHRHGAVTLAHARARR